MQSVNVREARLLEQWLSTTIGGMKYGDLIKLIQQDLPTLTKAKDLMNASELYLKVGGDIEAKAKELVDTKCKPEWDRISEEMKPLGERRNELAKKKVAPETDAWSEEEENELNELDKKLSDLSAEYQKITDEANAELKEYKEERINQEEGGAFLLEDDEYKLVGEYAGF